MTTSPLRLALPLVILTAPLAFAQTSSSSGNWTNGAIWAGGNAPASAAVTIGTGHTVAAGAGADYDAASSTTNLIVNGILDVTTGASINAGRVGATNTAGIAGVINVIGGELSVQSAPTYHLNSTLTINVSGGVFRTVTAGYNNTAYATLNLTAGGTVSYVSGNTGTMVTSWNGGRLVTNTSTQSGTTYPNLFWDGFKGNTANIWDLSDQATAQTFTVTSYMSSAPAATTTGLATTGTVQFDVYSPTSSDKIAITVNTTNLTFSSGVTFDINGVNLTGNASDYLGKTYRLFDYASGNYSGIQASIASTVWNIDGVNYDVTFTNDLSTTGTLTVAGLALSQIPEPSSVAALAGVAALALVASRRSRR